MYQAEVSSKIAQKCENFTKSEIYSNIAQINSIVPNLTFKGHPVQRSWGQLKDYIHVYDFLYVFHVKFGQNMHHSEDKAH